MECKVYVMRNKKDIAVLIFSSVSLREIHSVKLRVVKMIKHSVSRRDTEWMVTCYLFCIPKEKRQNCRACPNVVNLRLKALYPLAQGNALRTGNAGQTQALKGRYPG